MVDHGHNSRSRLVGIVALLVLFPLSIVVAPLVLAVASTVVVLGIALTDHFFLPAPATEAVAAD